MHCWYCLVAGAELICWNTERRRSSGVQLSLYQKLQWPSHAQVLELGGWCVKGAYSTPELLEFVPFRSKKFVDFAVLSKVIVLFLFSCIEHQSVFLALPYKASLFSFPQEGGWSAMVILNFTERIQHDMISKNVDFQLFQEVSMSSRSMSSSHGTSVRSCWQLQCQHHKNAILILWNTWKLEGRIWILEIQLWQNDQTY